MATILEQAIIIRDATELYANTPERVGECLVDIANALDAGSTTQSVGCGTSETTAMDIVTPDTYVAAKFASSSSWSGSDDLAIMTDGMGDSQVYFKYTGVDAISALVTFSLSASNDTADASIKAAIGNQSNSDYAFWCSEAQPFDAGKTVSITVQKLQYLNTDETVRLWVTSDAASTISITKLQASIIQI